jgi:hypothetical protein
MFSFLYSLSEYKFFLKVPIVETGNDLYKTVVRLQLILFSKDIGAF